MLERELKKPVADMLKSIGMKVAYECFLGGYCDVIGYKFSERTCRRIPPLDRVLAVELKLHNATEAIRQVKIYRHWASEVVIAMPLWRISRMRSDTLQKFRDEQIGLWAVDGVNASVVIHSVRIENERIQEKRRSLWRWYRKEHAE